MNIMDFTPGMGPARGFLYMAVAVKLIEPGVGVSLQYSTEACKMGLKVDAFSVRLYANHTAGASTDPALRSSRTYVHNRPVFVFLLPGNRTGMGVSSAWSLPSVST